MEDGEKSPRTAGSATDQSQVVFEPWLRVRTAKERTSDPLAEEGGSVACIAGRGLGDDWKASGSASLHRVDCEEIALRRADPERLTSVVIFADVEIVDEVELLSVRRVQIPYSLGENLRVRQINYGNAWAAVSTASGTGPVLVDGCLPSSAIEKFARDGLRVDNVQQSDCINAIECERSRALYLRRLAVGRRGSEAEPNRRTSAIRGNCKGLKLPR